MAHVTDHYFVIRVTDFSNSTISGKLIDSQTRQPISSAYINWSEQLKGVESDLHGKFVIERKGNLEDQLSITHLTYKDKKVVIDSNYSKESLIIFLEPDTLHLDPILIKEQERQHSYKFQGFRGQINDEIDAVILPVHLVNTFASDIMRSISVIPGITSTDESANHINIRGSTSDQHLIMWDRIPLYHSSHYFGFLSAFNPDILDQVELKKGYFSPKYSSRSSGLINFSSISPNQKDFRPKIQWTPFFVKGSWAVSTPNQKAGLLMSMNTSITQWLNFCSSRNIFDQIFQSSRIEEEKNLILDSSGKGPQIRFFDYQLKGHYNFSNQEELSVSLYSGKDVFTNDFRGVDFQSEDFWREFNWGLNMTYNKTLANNWTAQLELTQSNYQKKETNLLTEQIERWNLLKGSLKEFNWRWEWTKEWNNNQRLMGGFQRVNRRNEHLTQLSLNKNNEDDVQEKFSLNSTAFYLEYESSLFKNLKINSGFRYNHYSEVQRKVYWEPRFLASWKSNKDHWKVFFSAAKFNQEVYQTPIIYNELGVNSSIWQLSNFEEFPLIQSNEISIGTENKGKNYQWKLNFYSKKNEGISAWKMNLELDQFNLINETGHSLSRGIEFYFHFHRRQSSSILSYTASQTLQQYLTINGGKYFLANHHQAHHLKFIQKFDFKKWDIIFDFRLIEGRPYSIHKGIASFFDEEENLIFYPRYEELNSGKLPLYHRLDVSINYPLVLKKTKLEFNLSFFNIYGQNNIQEILNIVYPPDPTAGVSQPEILTIQKRMLPFLPFLSLKMEL